MALPPRGQPRLARRLHYKRSMKEYIADTSTLAGRQISPAAANASSEPAAIRIWLVDDNEDVRDAMAALLHQQGRLVCERQFGTAEGALAALARGNPPQVILLDLNLGSQSGIDAIRPMKSLAPATRVLMLTTFFDTVSEFEALEAGAMGFLLKSYELPLII